MIDTTAHAPLAALRGQPLWRKAGRQRGFTLIELLIAMVIIAILATIALPSYQRYVVRASRESAQAQLLDLANTQEKIFLNSNAYATNLTAAYNGSSGGGLGVTSGKTADSRYTLALTATALTYTITATPVSGTSQANDGTLTITETGRRTWGSSSW